MPGVTPNRDPEPIFLSVVTPAFNEEANLARLLEEIQTALQDLTQAWECLVVDDCSTDDSLALLRSRKESHPELRILRMQQRSGQTAAMDVGIRRSRGRFIATLDADLQNDPKELPRLLELVTSGQCDMATGWRKERQDNWLRRLSTLIANGVRNRLTQEQIHDSGCCLRVFTRDAVSRVKMFNGMHRFLPTLVKMEGYRVLETPVTHRPRVAGVANYGVSNRALRGLRDTFAVRWMQQRVVRTDADEIE